MLTQALLIGIWAGIAGIDLFNGLTHIHRPLVTGAIVGLILGDFKTGLMAGATLELVWAGMVWSPLLVLNRQMLLLVE